MQNEDNENSIIENNIAFSNEQLTVADALFLLMNEKNGQLTQDQQTSFHNSHGMNYQQFFELRRLLDGRFIEMGEHNKINMLPDAKKSIGVGLKKFIKKENRKTNQWHKTWWGASVLTIGGGLLLWYIQKYIL